MPLYEHVFMLRQDVSNAQAEALREQFKSILEDNGGKVERSEYWGLKPLAYRIRKNRKAHYTMLNITAPAAAVKEMERQMSLNDDVIRFLTIRVDAHDTEPSAMMRSPRGRDERGGRAERDRGGRGARGPREPAEKPGDSETAETPSTEAK